MNLTASDIISIIKECKGSVQSFSISDGTVSVVFNSTPIEAKNSTLEKLNSKEDSSESKVQLHLQPFDFDLAPVQQAEEEEDQNMIEELKMTDPLKYEELLALGELENDKEDNQ